MGSEERRMRRRKSMENEGDQRRRGYRIGETGRKGERRGRGREYEEKEKEEKREGREWKRVGEWENKSSGWNIRE